MPVPGLNQGYARVLRFRIPTDALLVPGTAVGRMTFELPGLDDGGVRGSAGRLGWQTFHVASSPFAAGEAFLMPGEIDPGSQQAAPASVIRTGYDVSMCGVLRLRRPVTQFSVYSTAVHAGGVLEIYAIDGDAAVPAAAVSIGAVNATIVGPLSGGAVESREKMRAATPSQSVAAMTAASAVVANVNANRVGGVMVNAGANPVALRLAAAAAVFANDLVLAAGGALDFHMPNGWVYQGEVRGICDAGLTSSIRVLEYT